MPAPDNNLSKQGLLQMKDAAAPDPAVADLGADPVARTFNHDLLLDEADQKIVRLRWPTIAKFLIDPLLIQRLKKHERSAKLHKQCVQYLGTAAVLLTAYSLLGVTAHSALHLSWADPWEWTFHVAALIGFALAVAASRWGPFRRRWLGNRFIAELLRQWHFRRLLASVDADDVAAQIERRKRDLQGFLHGLAGAVPQKMDRLIENADDPLPAIPEPKLPKNPEARAELLEAYQQLRLDHQLDFAFYKLSPDDNTILGLSNRLLVQLTQGAAGLTLFFALVVALLPLFNIAHGLGWVAVMLAIAGVAVRAWRDGLLLGEERERYLEVRHRLELLQDRWRAAPNDDARFALGRELEQAALRELRQFLRQQEQAQFLF